MLGQEQDLEWGRVWGLVLDTVWGHVQVQEWGLEQGLV